ncbi:MAG: methionyl-tRNA formyltransferase [bacterium]|nr:methionyl-tRNA formyltransferase [bacterium]
MEVKSILFMGTPDIALQVLKQLYVYSPEKITAVFTKPDAKRGRSNKMVPSPVKKWAMENDIQVFAPNDKLELQEKVFNLNPDLIIVVAYGIIFPKSITDRYFCINIHGSILPGYRGASPVQAAIINRDMETGITLIKMNDRMDQGDILIQEKIAVDKEDNFESLHNRMCGVASKVMVDYLKNNVETGNIVLRKQDEALATYCKKIGKEDLLLDLKQDSNVLIGKIKAFSPLPGAYILNEGKRIKILDAGLVDGELEIMLVKPEGKPQMLYRDYLLAHKPIID